VELDNEAFSLQRRVDRMQDDLDHGDGAFTLGQLRVNTVKTGEMNSRSKAFCENIYQSYH